MYWDWLKGTGWFKDHKIWIKSRCSDPRVSWSGISPTEEFQNERNESLLNMEVLSRKANPIFFYSPNQLLSMGSVNVHGIMKRFLKTNVKLVIQLRAKLWRCGGLFSSQKHTLWRKDLPNLSYCPAVLNRLHFPFSPCFFTFSPDPKRNSLIFYQGKKRRSLVYVWNQWKNYWAIYKLCTHVESI